MYTRLNPHITQLFSVMINETHCLLFEICAITEKKDNVFILLVDLYISPTLYVSCEVSKID